MKSRDSQMTALCSALRYQFKNVSLLDLALTHCSHNGAKGLNNQRLEFLGDAVLDFVISEWLYVDANVDEGHLTRMRANVVCEASLAEAARQAGVGKLILLGKGEESTGGRDKPSVLADTVEAILGAVFLDGGLEAVRNCSMHMLRDAVQVALGNGGEQDHKTMLQQICAQRQMPPPAYETMSIEGPPHEPLFSIGVFIADKMLFCSTGKTKKQAEQRAAKHAIEILLGKADANS